MYIYNMNKTKWIIGLLFLLIITFLAKPFVDNYLRESFVSQSGIRIGELGHELDYKPQVNIPNGNLFGNMRYPGKAYLSIAEPSGYLYNNQSDDSITFFSFPFLK